MSPPVSRNAGVKCPSVDHLLVSGCYSETASLCIIQHLIVMHCPQCQGHVLGIHKTTSDLRQQLTKYLTSRDLAFKICLLLFRTSKNVTCILLSVVIMNVFRQTVCNLRVSLALNFIILQHYLLTKTGFKSKCWFYYWKIFNFQSFFTTKE